MNIDQTNLRNELKSFINFNQVRQRLSLDFDGMCVHILSKYHRTFSPAELERVCIRELKKLDGFPICTEMYDEIAKFVDEMTMYMHQKGMDLGEERNEKLKKRFEKYTEDLAKSKHYRNKK